MSDPEDSSSSTAASTPARGIFDTLRASVWSTPSTSRGDPFVDTPTSSPAGPPGTPWTGESELFTTPREGPESPHVSSWKAGSRDLEEFQRRVENLGRDPRVRNGDTSQLGVLVRGLAAKLGFVAPREMMGWGENDFREAQMGEVKKLEDEKSRLHAHQTSLRDRVRFLGEEVGRMYEYILLATGDRGPDESVYFDQRDVLRAQLIDVDDELGELRDKLDGSPQSPAGPEARGPALGVPGDNPQPSRSDLAIPAPGLLETSVEPRTPSREGAAKRRDLRDRLAAAEQRRIYLMLKEETVISLIEGQDILLFRGELEAKEEELKDVATRLAEVDSELSNWRENAEKSTDFVTPGDVVAERKKYQTRISDLESAVDDLKREKRRRGRGSDGGANLGSPTRVREGALERRWLEDKFSYPATSEDWEEQVKAILACVREREAELEKEMCYVTDRKADLDFKEAEILGYRKRVEGDVRSVQVTAEELLDMIHKVRDSRQNPTGQQGRGAERKGKGRGGGGEGVPMLKTMSDADGVFKDTQDLAGRIMVKVETTMETMKEFWEDSKRKQEMNMRSSWELIRVIKARDDKITGLEGEVRNLGGKVARFIRQLDRVKETANQIVDAAESQATDGTRALKDQISTLTHLVSRIVSEGDDDGANVSEAKKAEPAPSDKDEDKSSLLWKDEYGNVIKMADKFSVIKGQLEMQVDKLQALTLEYKASRDTALNSAKELGATCKQLRDDIESLKDKNIREIETAVRDCEARHSKELKECRAELDAAKKALKEGKEELQRKTAECEGLEDKVTEEKKRLLEYKENRFLVEGDLDPVVQALLVEGDKQRKILEDKVVKLKDMLSGLKSRNSALEKSLESEKRRLEDHLAGMNLVPKLQRDLHEVRTAAGEYQRDLKATKSEAETLRNKLRTTEKMTLDLKHDDLQMKRYVSELRSDLREQGDKVQKKASDAVTKLKIEVERTRNEMTHYRGAFNELDKKHREMLDQITTGEVAAKKPSGLLKSSLSDVVKLRQEVLDVQKAALKGMSDRDYAVRELKELNEDLILLRESEMKLRDDLATTLTEHDELQAKYDSENMGMQDPWAAAEAHENRNKNASEIWDDTPAGVSNNVLQTRIETLTENLSKVLENKGPLKGVKEESQGQDLDTSNVKNPMVLFDSVQQIYATWYPDTGPPQTTVTRADMAIFWHHGTLIDKRLALLRAIRDGDKAGGYKIMDDLSHFLQETDLGPMSDEIWGSVQYLQAYFHLYTTGDIAAAEAATQRAREHRPKGWSSRYYRDLGSRLEVALEDEREYGRSRAGPKTRGAKSCGCIVRVLSCAAHKREECSCTHRNTIKYCQAHEEHFAAEAILEEELDDMG